jgi:hypothetical protein
MRPKEAWAWSKKGHGEMQLAAGNRQLAVIKALRTLSVVIGPLSVAGKGIGHRAWSQMTDDRGQTTEGSNY